ncbi:uncharacterized protein [Anoplolepis gracilipes]|uniref:uncharacterized protein isoform X2 n=1 Tax=Anoplolepis gracilipes TaxID=354296 RepID=UPI003BA37142
MEGSARNEIDLENVESSQSDVITSNIRQFITLKHSVENSNRKVQYFKKEMSNLVESNRNIETNLNKLEKDVFDIEAKIEMTRKSHNEKKQELKDLESVKMNILRKQWNGCLSKIGNYSNDFCQWITKYSRDILMKDIENHQRECSKVGNELAILKQEVDDMRKKCGLNCTEINVDVDDDLLKFDSIENQ